MMAFSGIASLVYYMKPFTTRESHLWLKTLWDPRQNLRIPRERLEAAQLKKFGRLVSCVQRHSPFYRAIIRKASASVRG